ncbi:hypothetical protein GYMLUDRAFT_675865 [Collybiopsis luxurians FD-317 M1]|uniref:Unplaced genomic scaffold GYMLUscaffold_32, whole genome shotgun sequence n=1 Tax=Collybiopsis luxurians FD-317 M1 TaxID=944289 RepID=A0A0D0BUT8_9AGAR|nr:hypothetical protein GYMLUDRAFT_675865 [Collybiopsis luxurians FD-317 M1]
MQICMYIRNYRSFCTSDLDIPLDGCQTGWISIRAVPHWMRHHLDEKARAGVCVEETFSTDPYIVLISVLNTKSGKHEPIPDQLCISLLLFRVVSCQCMLLVLHLILLLRVFALYSQSLLIGVFLLVLIIMGFAGPTVSIVLRFTGTKYKYDGLCHPVLIAEDRSADRWQNRILILVGGELATQLTLHGLAWKRTIWDFRTLTLFRPALLPVLNRDGLKVFAGILVAMISIGVGVFKRGTPVVFIFPLLMTFISAAGTRTILNLQALSISDEAPPSLSKSSNQVELTTIEDLTTWEAPWDTSTLLDE